MTLCVRHGGNVVGVLSQRERELEFCYSTEWLARPKAFPLSPRLPLADAPYLGEEVLFFFANLLPEGPVLDALTRLRRLPRANTYRLLEAMGRECAGAFEIVSENEDTTPNEARYARYSEAEIRADLADLRNNGLSSIATASCAFQWPAPRTRSRCDTRMASCSCLCGARRPRTF